MRPMTKEQRDLYREGWYAGRVAALKAVEAERLADVDVAHDREHGHGDIADAYNLAIRHAVDSVRVLECPKMA